MLCVLWHPLDLSKMHEYKSWTCFHLLTEALMLRFWLNCFDFLTQKVINDKINMWCVFQPCAPRRAPTVAPVCAGTSVCAFWAGLEPAATQVQQHISVEQVHPTELDCSKVPLCYRFILICFLWIYGREKEWFTGFCWISPDSPSCFSLSCVWTTLR